MSLVFGQIAADSRLLSNLIAAHVLVLGLMVLSVAMRWVLTRGSKRVADLAGTGKMKEFSEEATRQGRAVLFWLTLAAMGAVCAGVVAYHFYGRDVRTDMTDWYSQLTARDVVRLCVAVGGVLLLALAATTLTRLLRRLVPQIEKYANNQLGDRRNEAVLHRWFRLLETFAVLGVRLGALWAAGQLVGAGPWADVAFGFAIRLVAVLAAARLLTLACRATTHLVADYGTKQLDATPFRRYWERVTRLFPFGERCFDAAVYIWAASWVVKEFEFVAVIAGFGPRIVECIGIFFCTRVLIELLHVLLHEAFGLNKADRQADQKRQTLVPLLHSICQYVLYFGSVVMMLGVLGIPTQPFLAGAGILGLAVGLGAQSLVTDVVSGFFILFENQFLVGDYVKIGDAAGTVEEVGMRVTKIRDGNGKLYIIPNGQIKGVISYSKGYVNAVVDVKLPSGSDLEGMFRAMKEAGRRLRAERREVLADTEIHGLVEWNTSDMTVRAVTKVTPGKHGLIQNEYRRVLKQVFDEKQAPSKPALAA